MKYLYGLVLLAAGLINSELKCSLDTLDVIAKLRPLPQGSYKNYCDNCKWIVDKNGELNLSCTCRYSDILEADERTKHTTKKGCKSYGVDNRSGDLVCE